MNNNSFTTDLATKMALDEKSVDTLINALAGAIESFCTDMDAVAIPGFGTFQPIKNDESLETDSTTGRRILLPPSIRVEFKPSVILRKQLNR